MLVYVAIYYTENKNDGGFCDMKYYHKEHVYEIMHSCVDAYIHEYSVSVYLYTYLLHVWVLKIDVYEVPINIYVCEGTEVIICICVSHRVIVLS